MKARDIAELAGRNLREAVLRNGLTTLGIAVGVASLVAMLSLGVGLQELTSKRMTRTGLFDVVFVLARGDFGTMGGNRRAIQAATQNRRRLDEAARQEIEKLPNVAEAYAEMSFLGELRYEDKRDTATVGGLPESAREREAFQTMHGKFFSGPEAQEVILHRDTAEDLSAQPAELVGKEVVLNYVTREAVKDAAAGGPAKKRAEDEMGFGGGFAVTRKEVKLKVVGVLVDEVGSFRGFGRGRIYVPRAVIPKMNPVQANDIRDLVRQGSEAGQSYQALTVRVTSPAHVPAVQEAIRKLGFGATSLLDAAKSLARAFAILDLFLGIIGSVALVVASLGIVNTLVMSVLERRREIGILKALGASNGVIKRLFFAEAMAMGFSGGALGVFMGWVLGKMVNFGTKLYMENQELPPETIMTVPLWLVAGAIGFAILVSLASGIYPAAQAAKLDPVEALRYE